MKKYIGTMLVAVGFTAMIAGCQKIDQMPKDDLSDGQFWKSASDFKKAANALYITVETLGVQEVDSDIGYQLTPNAVSNGSWSPPDTDGEWSDRFSDLRNCNKIIEKGQNYAGIDSVEVRRYVAEARFFRAYNHWRLLRKFNNVPILTKVLDTQSPELYAKREPQAAVEDFMLAELEAAAAKLPRQSELAAGDIGRVTQGAALALKARVALYAASWAKFHNHRTDAAQLFDQCISAAERVIDSKQYQLYEGAGNESYRQMFIEKGDDNVESIFANRYALDIRTHSTSSSVYWGWRGSPTKKLADMYLVKSTGLPIQDPSSGFKGYAKITDEFIDRDPRMTQTILVPGTNFRCTEGAFTCNANFAIRPETRTGYKLWKFMGEVQATSVLTTYDVHLLRYAEVLLNLAEATYEKNNAISDEVLNKTINAVRGRAGVQMPALTNAFVLAHGLNMRTEIRRERTIELAFEGYRRDDIRRWKTAEAELSQALKGIKYKGTEYEQQKVLNDGNPGLVDDNGFLIVEEASARTFVAPKHYYFPIPLNEIFLNPNLGPNNPGWQ